MISAEAKTSETAKVASLFKIPNIVSTDRSVPIVEHVESARLQYTALEWGLNFGVPYIEYIEKGKRYRMTIEESELSRFLYQTFNARGYGYNDVLCCYHNGWAKRMSIPRQFKWVNSSIILAIIISFKHSAKRV